MMLFNDLGQQFGLLSGGCLEADIQRHAARVMHSKRSLTVSYDGSDEDDITFQLGIGCGGTVHILLQPILPELHYLHLSQVHDQLELLAACRALFYSSLPADGAVETRWEMVCGFLHDRSSAKVFP